MGARLVQCQLLSHFSHTHNHPRCSYAGQVVGIGRLGAHVLKTATLCSTPACPSLSSISVASTPLVRVAVEPLHTRDRDAVERGLALLNQADPCVDVTFLDSGEMQLVRC